MSLFPDSTHRGPSGRGDKVSKSESDDEVIFKSYSIVVVVVIVFMPELYVKKLFVDVPRGAPWHDQRL